MEGMRRIAMGLAVLGALTLAGPGTAWADAGAPLPAYLRDRGPGLHTSLFGTYVEKGQLLFYPFYEYTRTTRFEYKPSELGHTGGADYLGKLVEQEALVYLAYGFTDRLMAEFESALYARGDFTKAPDDPSAVPANLHESGLGDTEGQVRYRFLSETESRPEVLGYFELTLPLQKKKALIGTQHWEYATGLNVTKGLPIGTFMVKAGLAYESGEGSPELGEYGVEYLKRLSDAWRMVLSLEGESDELSAIGEAQYRLAPGATLKLNSGFGLTPKAPDFAPEVGVVFAF